MMNKNFLLGLCLLVLMVAVPAVAVVNVIGTVDGSDWAVEDDFSTDTSANYADTINGNIEYLIISGGVATVTESWKSVIAYHKTSLGSADQIVQAKIERGAVNQSELVFRYDTGATPNTGYSFKPLNNDLVGTLRRFTGTSYTTITNIEYTDGKTWASDTVYLVQAEISSNSITIKIDFNADGDFDDDDESYGPFTDSTYSAGNHAGIFWSSGNGPDAIADNFKAKAR